jgi:hypothetical protein
MTVDLTEQEWNAVINILATAAWKDANPLLVRISQQLQAQKTAMPMATASDGLDPIPPERH